MSELTTNLNNILDIKGNIKSALENKGVDMTGVSFGSYPDKIGEITTSFVTVPLNVSANGTYTPGQGVDGYSQVVVDVPISGWDQKSFTEGTIEIINLNNSASFVASSAFYNNKTIQTVNLPYATSVGESAFQSCNSLTKVDLPMCSLIGNYALDNCKSLTLVNLPMCIYINGFAFQNCSSLTQISLPMCMNIGTFAFRKCSSLSIITIGSSRICTLGYSTALSDTLITSGTGSIYVPASLVDVYKSTTHWSYFATQIVPIPE